MALGIVARRSAPSTVGRPMFRGRSIRRDRDHTGCPRLCSPLTCGNPRNRLRHCSAEPRRDNRSPRDTRRTHRRSRCTSLDRRRDSRNRCGTADRIPGCCRRAVLPTGTSRRRRTSGRTAASPAGSARSARSPRRSRIRHTDEERHRNAGDHRSCTARHAGRPRTRRRSRHSGESRSRRRPGTTDSAKRPPLRSSLHRPSPTAPAT